MRIRTVAVAAAGVSAVVVTAAGLTYASAAADAPAASSAQQAAAAPAPRADRPPAQVAAPAQPAAGNDDRDGDSGSDRDGGKGGDERGGRDRDSGGDHGRDGGGRGHGGHGDHDEGKIYFNERMYSASATGCVTAAGGLGSTSFSVFNDSERTVEVYRGFTCDNGAPVATVGPHGATHGVVTDTFHDGLLDGFGHGMLSGDDGVVGSFRVLDDDEKW
ncbi:hypothetical protein [Streptomyces thermodiastaticus]|uniref:hypothetical protein n=1 Tax=Streptomyces thermodiastaticus TaxID=44061 RepID=UPI001678F4B7|nr:hypothetical protein [Streptomyces thermodiastaticus]MCE7550347.1 hypothetical protein [Streptomyces thermodiastaticus]GHF68731.1 hypothetical protein GCM10018787_16340 [Streptomyces thermodiastaticus]